MMQFSCACRGIRTCAICEDGNRKKTESLPRLSAIVCRRCSGLFKNPTPLELESFEQLSICQGCFEKVNKADSTLHLTCKQIRDWVMDNSSKRMLYSDELWNKYLPEQASFGVKVVPNILTELEANELVNIIDNDCWVQSQSGRRKQDFGVQINFSKKKVKLGIFNGLPAYAQQYLLPKLQTTISIADELSDFIPVELCNLEYRKATGSAIDPHLDDMWVWGERIIGFNILGSTFLTFTCSTLDFEIKFPLPARSLILFKGVSRSVWFHAINREDVPERRVTTALRELSQEFLIGDSRDVGHLILERAAKFNGTPINVSENMR